MERLKNSAQTIAFSSSYSLVVSLSYGPFSSIYGLPSGSCSSPSKCYVMYKSADFNTNRYFLNDIKSERFKTHKLQMLVKMEQYLAVSKCRRRYLYIA